MNITNPLHIANPLNPIHQSSASSGDCSLMKVVFTLSIIIYIFQIFVVIFGLLDGSFTRKRDVLFSLIPFSHFIKVFIELVRNFRELD